MVCNIHSISACVSFRLRPPTPQGVILSLSNFWGTQKHEAKPSGISVGYAQDDMVEKRANEITRLAKTCARPQTTTNPIQLHQAKYTQQRRGELCSSANYHQPNPPTTNKILSHRRADSISARIFSPNQSTRNNSIVGETILP